MHAVSCDSSLTAGLLTPLSLCLFQSTPPTLPALNQNLASHPAQKLLKSLLSCCASPPRAVPRWARHADPCCAALLCCAPYPVQETVDTWKKAEAETVRAEHAATRAEEVACEADRLAAQAAAAKGLT